MLRKSLREQILKQRFEQRQALLRKLVKSTQVNVPAVDDVEAAIRVLTCIDRDDELKNAIQTLRAELDIAVKLSSYGKAVDGEGLFLSEDTHTITIDLYATPEILRRDLVEDGEKKKK